MSAIDVVMKHWWGLWTLAIFSLLYREVMSKEIINFDDIEVEKIYIFIAIKVLFF